MLPVYLLVSLLYTALCYNISIPTKLHNDKLTQCVIDIIKEYLTDRKGITYVGNKVRDEELLKAINGENIVSVISRQASAKMSVPHQAYLISASNAHTFATRFSNITKESTWNPMARFLILVKNLKETDLKIVFDIFLKLHANNVVLINATEDAYLYTYNPFDNYNCGKKYDTIISYGKCSESHSIDLYPEKIVTGIRNCTYNVLIVQWPPYTMVASNNSNDTSPLRFGAEPYLLRIIGEMQGFKINIICDYTADVEDFSSVSANMEAVGTLKKIKDNEADIVLGGMLLIPSRAVAFSYIFGQFVYTDEIRFLVKRAAYVRPWKNLYLEFESSVWLLLTLAFTMYSILLIVLLRKKDKSYVVLMLIDNIVLHGCNIRCRWTVKCVLIIWVWFAYLVNTFYQSSLVSLTTNPAKEYQIASEEDIVKFRLKPCFSYIMSKYYMESVQSDDRYHKTDGCYGLMESISTVSKSEYLFTILLYGIYQYNRQDFFDEYGTSEIYSIQKPYSKVIYAMYMYKGFPLIEELSQKSIQLRENGLVDKVMRDLNYIKQVKHNYRVNEFRGRFAIPWLLYFLGCFMSIITFAIEMISKRK